MDGNFFVIGGPISVGKSTLANNLGFPQVLEIEKNDPIQEAILTHTYDKKRIKSNIIEFYFLQKRKSKYIQYANKPITHSFDRSIFGSLWFAKKNLDKKEYIRFKKLYDLEIKQLINEHGKPKIYIFLSVNWENFKKRLFTRGRKFEIDNFKKNETFFKNHIEEYEMFMIKIFNQYDIKYKVIKTDKKSVGEVIEETRDILKKHNL